MITHEIHGVEQPTPDSDAELFRSLYPSLRRFAAAYAPPSIEPEDLVQQAVANTLAIRSLSSLRDPGAYLRASVANLARNLYRKPWPEVGLEDADIAASDHYPSDLGELACLSPLDRAALFLVDVERLPGREAAAALGCSSFALRTRVSRARRTLREALLKGPDR